MNAMNGDETAKFGKALSAFEETRANAPAEGKLAEETPEETPEQTPEQTPEEIIEFVAKGVWRNDRRNSEYCPRDKIPTVEELGQSLHKQFQAAFEGSELMKIILREAFQKLARWQQSHPAKTLTAEELKAMTPTMAPTFEELKAIEAIEKEPLLPPPFDTLPFTEDFDVRKIVVHLHSDWLAARPFAGKHPLADAVRSWQARPSRLAEAKAIVSRAFGLTTARQPAVLALTQATLTAVMVDGEPLVAESPSGRRRRYRIEAPPKAPQGDFFQAPKTLDGRATGGAFIEAIADLNLTGDERSPLRADTLRIGSLAFNLDRSAILTEAEGAVLVAGRDTRKNRERFNRAMWCLRSLRYEAKKGIYWALLGAEPGETNVIGPPRWWLEKKGPMAYRLSGALFMPSTRWGAVERTVTGIEGGLTWGPPNGTKGRNAKLAEAVTPVAKGGVGPERFVPWWQVLRLAGEHVGPDIEGKARGAAIVRYNDRVDMLEASGWFVPDGRTGTLQSAHAGGTIEIVDRVRGGNGRTAGIWVRATARFCAAYTDRKKSETRIPAQEIVEMRKSPR